MNSPQKIIRKKDTNIQRTLQVRVMFSGRLVPTKPVGQAHPTNRDTSEPTTAGKRDTKIISICVPQRNTWFQLHTNVTIGVRHPNSLKARPQVIVGTPLNQWVVSGNFQQSLLLLKYM